jgi:ribosome-associated protein
VGSSTKPGGGRTSRGPRAVKADLPITLGQFVKLAGLASTGGDAKLMVVDGRVRVNGEVDTRRGRKLAFGDVVRVEDEEATVTPRTGGSPAVACAADPPVDGGEDVAAGAAPGQQHGDYLQHGSPGQQSDPARE